MDPGGHQGADAIVQLVHHHRQENVEREAHHVLHQRQVVGPEGHRHFQHRETIEHIGQAAHNGQHQRQRGDGRRAKPQQQQGNGDQRAQHGLGHGDSLQEQVALMDIHMGLEHTERERKRCVDGHDPQQLCTQSQLLRGPLGAEHHLRVRCQEEAQGQQYQTQQRQRHQEHAVELGHFPPVLGHLGLGIVADIGTAQAHTQQQQVRDDGTHRPVNTVFRFAQPVQHNGRVDQRDQRAQPHGHIGQHRAQPHLIHLQGSTLFLHIRDIIPDFSEHVKSSPSKFTEMSHNSCRLCILKENMRKLYAKKRHSQSCAAADVRYPSS